MKHFARCAGIAAIVMAAIPAYAQSLGDLARQEEARRAAATKAAKLLSNADLRPQDIREPSATAAAPVESCYVSISKGGCVTAEELVSLSTDRVVTRENAPHEQEWRQEADSLRSRIVGGQRAVTALEATAADQSKSPGERKSAERSVVTSRQALAGFERQWERFEANAVLKKVPRPWIEPVPTLTTKQSPQ